MTLAARTHSLARGLSRRHFLAGLGGGAAALALGPHGMLALGRGTPVAFAPARTPGSAAGLKHLAWVWQFQHDGEPSEIRDVLGTYGLGVVLKTHDGADWMSTYDDSPEAITGPAQVLKLAAWFENAGVPFHAWCVVHGEDPVREAELAANVLSAGARTLFIDLEPHRGFWKGTAETALRFGEELRRQQPNARLSTSIDPRPWEIDNIPLTEFSSFTNEISPQVYWPDFSTPPNIARWISSGHPPGDGGVTAAFVLQNTMTKLQPFSLPVHPIGAGTVGVDEGWTEFVEQSIAYEVPTVSVWRYGVTDHSVWQLLHNNPPSVAGYAVQPGDTLGTLASAWGTDVATIMQVNGITNPNLIAVGQFLQLPSGIGAPRSAAPAAAAPSVVPSAAAAGGAAGGVYVVEPGDSLSRLAVKWDMTVDAIAELNGIRNPNRIRIGQELRIP